MSSIEILGFLSALLALTAFAGNQYGKMTNESFLYDFLNFISAIGLGTYAAYVGATPFVLTSSVWALVSLGDLIKYARGKRKARRTPLRH